MSTPKHIASRLAIHESCHATALFLLNMPIHSIQISETEGVVHHPPSGDSFNEVVSLLAPHRLEEAFGWAESGDDWDEREVARILRKYGTGSAARQARAVLEEAADAMVLSPAFDTLRRALSGHLKPGTYMTGEEAEEILLEAFERHRWLMSKPAPRGRVEAHTANHSAPRPRYVPHNVGPNHNPDCIVCLSWTPDGRPR